MPATQSSQKWFPVAITANQTQAGQAIQNAFAHQCFATPARTMPTMSESHACRLGIAAYGFAASWTRPSVWSFAKPTPSSRGGAIGIEDVADRPMHVGEQDRVAETDEVVVAAEVDPEERQPDDRELGVPVRPRDHLARASAAGRRTAGT